jgi:hypothetical protein
MSEWCSTTNDLDGTTASGRRQGGKEAFDGGLLMAKPACRLGLK